MIEIIDWSRPASPFERGLPNDDSLPEGWSDPLDHAWPPDDWEPDPPEPGWSLCEDWPMLDNQPEFDPDIDPLAELADPEIAVWRNRLVSAAVPGGEVGLIDLLRALEDLKSTAAALQARVGVAFEAARRQNEADRGVAGSKRGIGISSEVALARRESPHRGGRLMGLARALVYELPQTLQALADGTLNEWRATLVARETACLDPADRARVDVWLATYLAANPVVGDKRLVAEVRRKVIEIDQAAVVKRRNAAAGERRVTLRPLPDGMVQLTAILGLREGVAVYAALKRVADQAKNAPADQAGDAPVGTSGPADERPRGRGAVMADTLVHRVTGNPASDPSGVDLTVVITAEALLAESDEPAHVDGYGPMPASWVRRLITDTADSEQRVAVRRLFRGPGRMVKLETAVRFMTPALRHLIAIRDQMCRTPWCGASIRQTDHVRAHTRGGPTSLLNGQGLCEACNYTKQQPGWRSTPRQDPDRGHIVTVTTPTGHNYESTQPAGPGDE